MYWIYRIIFKKLKKTAICYVKFISIFYADVSILLKPFPGIYTKLKKTCGLSLSTWL